MCSAGGKRRESPAAVQESWLETSLDCSEQVLQDGWSGFKSRARLGRMAGVHGTAKSRGGLCVRAPLMSDSRWRRYHSVSVLA